VAFVGALLLVFVIVVRPQEFIPALESYGLLNLATGIAVLGIAVELGLGTLKRLWSPQLPWVFAFLAWCYVTVIVRAGVYELDSTNRTILFSTIFMGAVMLGCRKVGRLRKMAGFLVLLGVFLAWVGITQASHPFECIRLSAEDVKHGQRTNGTPTGLPCVSSRLECDTDNRAASPFYSPEEFEYVCEKPGPFETFTMAHGRVRWRGILADPNELSMALGAALALAFFFHRSWKTKLRHPMMGTVITLIGMCVVRSQSRTGVLVLAAVAGVYFVKRYGFAKGLIVGAIMAGPVLLLGGRSGEEADSSSEERAGALFEGVDLVRQYPVFGVGRGLFGDHYFITAHNSYLLTAAELGLPGMLLWSIVMYVTMKIPFTLAFQTPPGTDPEIREFALALFVSLLAFLIGIAFLSFAYHNILWIYIGLSGALYGVARDKVPGWNVKLAGKEIGWVAGADVAILAVLLVFTRLHPGD
jgi:hypothetical protein